MPPDNRSHKSWLWPPGEESGSLWLTRTKRGVPLRFLNCQPRPWDLRVKDETVTLTTRSKDVKHDKCDYNIRGASFRAPRWETVSTRRSIIHNTGENGYFQGQTAYERHSGILQQHQRRHLHLRLQWNNFIWMVCHFIKSPAIRSSPVMNTDEYTPRWFRSQLYY